MAAIVSYALNTLSATTLGTLQVYWVTSGNVALGPLRHTDGNTSITPTFTTTSNWVTKYIDLSQQPQIGVANVSTSSSNNMVTFQSIPVAPVGYWSANIGINSSFIESMATNVPGASFIMGTGDFTVEMFHYPYVAPGATVLIDNRNLNTNATAPNLQIFTSSTGLYNVMTSGSLLMQSSVAMVQNTWQHVAYARQGTTGRLYVNGNLVASGTDATNYTDVSFYLGKPSGSTLHTLATSAYISNWRVVKGTAVYTGNTFPVPGAPLSSISGTSLLAANSNNLTYDTSGNNIQMYLSSTYNGDPNRMVSNLNPFNAPAYNNYGNVNNWLYSGSVSPGQNVNVASTSTSLAINWKNTVIITSATITGSNLTFTSNIGFLQVGMYLNGPGLPPNIVQIQSGSGTSWVVSNYFQSGGIAYAFLVGTSYILNQSVTSTANLNQVLTTAGAALGANTTNFGNIEGSTGRLAFYYVPPANATAQLAIDNVNIYLESQNIAFNFDTNNNGFLTSRLTTGGNIIAALNGSGTLNTTNAAVSTGNTAYQWSRVTASGGLIGASNTTVMYSFYTTTNTPQLTLFTPSITLYSNAFTGYRDATGTIFLGYTNASSTTTVNTTIGMQSWTSAPTFTLLGTAAQLPPGVTLSSGGVLSGTLNTNLLYRGLNRFTFSALVTYTMTDPAAGSGGTLTTGTSQQAFIYDVVYNVSPSADNTGTTEGAAQAGTTNQYPVANTNVYITNSNVSTVDGNVATQGNLTEVFNNYSMNVYIYSSSAVNYGASNQYNDPAAEGAAQSGVTNQYPVANTNVYISSSNVVAINVTAGGNIESVTSTMKPASLNALRTPVIIIG